FRERGVCPMFASDHQTARTHYLQALLDRYGTIALPLGSRAQNIALETVFQPLALRQRLFLTVEDEERERQKDASEQPAFADQQSPADQPVVVRNGTEALQQSPIRRLLVL